MKPHEETWAAHPDGTREGPGWVISDGGAGLIIATVHDPVRLPLMCAAPAMARALLAFIDAMDGSQCAEDSENARLQAEAALEEAGVLE